MKKQFEVRARLVCYMEQTDLNRLTAVAREEGKTLVDWARATLLARLAASNAQESALGRRSRPRTKSTIRAIEDVAHATARKTADGMVDVPRIPWPEGMCPHHKRAGELCYKCDPKMGFPRVAGAT